METVINRTLAPVAGEIEKIAVAEARKFALDNGIPVYALSAGFQDLVKIELLFPNKPFDLKNPLLNQATNRMLTEGTSKYNARQIADQIDNYGAFYETDENLDYTSVILYSLNKHLKNVLPYFADIIHDPVFPVKELDVFIQNNKQRLIVDNEKVNSVARRKFNEIIFGEKHPYGYFIRTKDYDTLQRGHLSEMHRQKYVPTNCTIIISGLVKDESINILNEYFGKAVSSNGHELKKSLVPFSPSAEKKHVVSKENTVQSAIRIGKPFINRTHSDYPGMAFVNTLLGGYFGSRLMSTIREEKGYTYGIGSAMVSMRQDGYFFITTEVGSEVTAPAIDAIYNEIELLKSEFVESDELEMVRNYMLGTFLKSTDGAFQLAERFKSIFLYNLDYTYYERYVNKIRTIEPDEIQNLAGKYFTSGDFFELVVGHK